MAIATQSCITRDKFRCTSDGHRVLQVVDPQRASHWYSRASSTAYTAGWRRPPLRSEMGKIDLDRTFEERTHINGQIVTEIDKR